MPNAIAAATAYLGHGANTGGLQQHSIGEDYPYVVVGTMHRSMDKPVDYVRYYVMNADTGARYYFKAWDGVVRTWASCRNAHAAATMLKNKERAEHIIKV